MSAKPVLEWDWDVEHEDRKREAKADAAVHPQHPFDVDRKVLRDVVKERMDIEVGRIKFLSSGEAQHLSHISSTLTGFTQERSTKHVVFTEHCTKF